VASSLEFRILGPLEVTRDGRPISIAAPRRRTLLGLLLLRANEPVSLDQLIEELWNGHPPRAAKASVHNQVAALRKVLGPDVIETHPSGYLISVDSQRLDLARFEALVAEARSAEWGARATKLREALAEWRGPPLIDVRCDGLQTETVRLEELRLVALEERIESELALGLNAELVPELESLVERHPLRERLWSHLMVALYRSGRQADALETYRRAHATLAAELGIEPSPALKKLQRAILVQDRRLLEPEGEAHDELLERIAPLLPTPDERSRARAVYEYAQALWLLGERDRSEAAFEKAAELAAAAGDRGLEELARLQLSWHALFTGHGSNIAHLERARRARRIFQENDDRAHLARAFQHEGFMLRDLGRAAEGAAAFSRGAEVAQEVGDAAQESACRDQACFARSLGPMPTEQAIENCEAEGEIVKQLGRSPIFGWWALGLLHTHRGKPTTDGLAFFELAEATCRDAELWHQLALTSFFRSWVYELVDDWASAERELRSVYEQFDAIADQGMLPLVAARLARILPRIGKLDEAEDRARWASRSSGVEDFHQQVGWRQGLALVEANLGRHAEANRLAREAVDLARRSDWLNLRAETLEDLAAVEASAGHTLDGCSALDEATALYERKGNLVARDRARRKSERLREGGSVPDETPAVPLG
jgi:DNA-binding SARP family transcriptional activator